MIEFFWKGDLAKIMAVCDGYVMARKKGCVPFIATIKEVEAAQHQRAADSPLAVAQIEVGGKLQELLDDGSRKIGGG